VKFKTKSLAVSGCRAYTFLNVLQSNVTGNGTISHQALPGSANTDSDSYSHTDAALDSNAAARSAPSFDTGSTSTFTTTYRLAAANPVTAKENGASQGRRVFRYARG
jgi:hypothetical protein